MTAIPAGTLFEGPNGQGYRLTRDLAPFDIIADPTLWRAEGGAPELKVNDPAPSWLVKQFGPRWL